MAATRGGEVLARLLGAVFHGILCSDRFSAYLKYHSDTAQFCWAHLKRNLLGILEYTKSSAVERFCRDALAEHARLFRLWHKFRGGLIDRQLLVDRLIKIQKRLVALAERHLDSSYREVANLALPCSRPTTGCTLSWKTKVGSRPTTAPNERSALASSGEKSVSATAAPMANRPRPAC